MLFAVAEQVGLASPIALQLNIPSSSEQDSCSGQVAAGAALAPKPRRKPAFKRNPLSRDLRVSDKM